MRKHRRHAVPRGMTLLEIMIVIAILGLIASVVVIRVMDSLAKARVNTARLKMGEVSKALDMYAIDRGGYPTQSEGLAELVTPREGRALLKDANDPWGRELRYQLDAEGRPVLHSMGPDGQDGTEDDIPTEARR